MPRQFKSARKMCQLKLMDAATELGVSQPTLSSWESGRKSPTIESILKMSQLYNVSTDFLLGKSLDGCGTSFNNTPTEQIPVNNLCVLHGLPVWSNEYGWLLVDAINKCFLAPDGLSIPFENNIQVYYKLDALVEGPVPTTEALSLSKLTEYDRVWVEPVSANFHLRQELRGWYTVMSDWVENSAGNRFLFGTYASKWLAFSEI